MYLELRSRKNYAQKNEDYRQITLPLLEYVFNPNRIVFGYVLSTTNNFMNQRHHILDPREINNIELIRCRENIGVEEIGVFEETLKTHIISQDYTVLILTGASGSGKTSVTKHVLNSIEECKDDKYCIRYHICKSRKKLVLYYDFLYTDTYNDIQQLDEVYQHNINAHLNQAVRSCFEDEDILEEFINHGRTPQNEFYQFYLTYCSEGKVKNIEEVLIKIRTGGDTNLIQNEVLASMLGYFRRLYPDHHKGCFTIVYDNIDKLNDLEQAFIINKIITLHNKIKCKLIITSRLTTFYKLKNNFSNTISVIENAGPKPIDILYNRIKFYLENYDTLEEIKEIRERINRVDRSTKKGDIKLTYLQSFDRILQTLFLYIGSIDYDSGEENDEVNRINFKKKQIQETFGAYSGLSVRRGLEIAKRFIHSYVYNYYDIPSSNQLIASLSFLDKRGLKFRDKYITNIFARYDDNRRNSWLIYKTLNILKISQENNIEITVGQLADILRLYDDDITDKNILLAINILINSHKRLAYVAGYSEILNIDDESYESQKIHVTNSGKNYINFLAYDLTYLQNCFAALDWKQIGFYVKNQDVNELHEKLSSKHVTEAQQDMVMGELKKHINTIQLRNKPYVFNLSNVFERMQFVRNSLKILLNHDIFEAYTFNRKMDIRKHVENIVPFLPYVEEINSFPALKMILTTSNSFVKILSSMIRNDKIREINIEELNNWQRFINIADTWNKLLFGANTNYGEGLIEKFEKLKL